MTSLLATLYPWTKSLHLISMVAWMAGLFYLPRLYVYHAERGQPGTDLSETLKVMEGKLLRLIMLPAMIATWWFGLVLVVTPGVVDLSSDGWFHVKLATLVGLTWYHHRLGVYRRAFLRDENRHTGRHFRIMNEVPTLALVLIVIMAVVKPF